MLTSTPTGVLKLFPTPKTALKPESWVPANVASYQTFNWDLDAAWVAVNDLVNMFNPGALAEVEKRLAGPDGQAGLSIEKDIVAPIGDRISIISDYQKPITPKSQRVLFGVALEDSKKFQATFNKVLEMTMAPAKKRRIPGNHDLRFRGP